MNATVQALADLLAEKAPNEIRIAFNEADRSTAPQSDAAHFLKFKYTGETTIALQNGEERRMGRDLELYSLVARLDDGNEQGLLVMLLEELVLPLKSYTPEAFTAAVAFMRDHGAVYNEKQGEWNTLLDSISKLAEPTTMTEDQVVELMASSTSAQSWDDNCLKVKAMFGNNYPPFWYKAILASGLAERTLNKFGETARITIAK